jgi:dTDP-4-dehydrorhamnose reductase
MDKLIITGANGQLGRELKSVLVNNTIFQPEYTDIEELDITNEEKVKAYIKQEKPAYIINCAAYNEVDQAEGQPEVARSINSLAPGLLAQASKEAGAKFIHISTDYVFDGKHYKPYTEDDDPNPVSAYAKSKRTGEHRVLETGSGIVIRTSWLYSPHGKNFVKTMMNLGKEREELNVVFDQTGSPTYAFDLANTILFMLTLYHNGKAFMPGIYHYSNEGTCSWYDFAKEIMSVLQLPCSIYPIETKDYPLPAPRPYYSLLNKGKIKSEFGITIPHWKDSLRECLDRMK